jgi:hypothetical protein
MPQLDDVFFENRNQLFELTPPTGAPFFIPRSPMSQLVFHTSHGSSVFVGVDFAYLLVSKYVPMIFGPRGGS